MKKSVFSVAVLAVFLVLVSIIISVNVSAAAGCFFPSAPASLGECNENVLNETKIGNYLNGCGKAEFTCRYVRRTFPTFCAGYYWIKGDCTEQGGGVCCAENTCGYEYYGESCDSCLKCGREGDCSVNLFDWTTCQEDEGDGFCVAGVCEVDNEDPVITDNQADLYIRDVSNLGEIYNKTFDIDFSDDVNLREYKLRVCDEESSQYFVDRSEFSPAPELIDGCAVETIDLDVKEYTENWRFSTEMWDWIIGTVLNQGKVSVNIDLTDKFGKTVLGNQLLFIVSDFTNPNISVSHVLIDVPGGKEVEVTALGSDMFGEIETKIFIDDLQIGDGCTLADCKRTKIFAEGAHTYFAVINDPSGNLVASNVGTFEIATEEAGPSTCGDFFGQVCVGDKICDQEVFSAADTNECCPGACVSEEVELLTCEDQEGEVFNPSSHTCEGEEVAANDMNEYLRCCVGILKEVPDLERLAVYWKDDGGNKIVSASLGDSVECAAGGITGTAKFEVSKEGVLKSQSLTLPNSIGVNIQEIGEYGCSVDLNGYVKKSDLKVIEVPALIPKKTALPGFSFVNVLAVLSLLFVYYVFLRGKKRW